MFTRENWILWIAVIVFVIGSLSGSAYVMLGMAAAGLALSALIYPWHHNAKTSLLVLTASVAAAVTAMVAASALSAR
jgi:hypothetical protein